MKSNTGYLHKWQRSILANLAAGLKLFGILKKNRLTLLIPFVSLLLILSVVLYLISFSTPLAPFVYSLF